jgi:hypothetical protein
MLNTALGVTAALVWITAYTWFFAHELRRWWRGRPARRHRLMLEREQARAAYAAWVRNIPPPRDRRPIYPPPPVPRAAPRLQPQGVVVSFPHHPRNPR